MSSNETFAAVPDAIAENSPTFTAKFTFSQTPYSKTPPDIDYRRRRWAFCAPEINQEPAGRGNVKCPAVILIDGHQCDFVLTITYLHSDQCGSRKIAAAEKLNKANLSALMHALSTKHRTGIGLSFSQRVIDSSVDSSRRASPSRENLSAFELRFDSSPPYHLCRKLVLESLIIFNEISRAQIFTGKLGGVSENGASEQFEPGRQRDEQA
ncbi:unnamed protein product, partial [Notodromas monacha]